MSNSVELQDVLRHRIVERHTPDGVSQWLSGVFPFSQVRWGNIKNGQGDIVVVNLGDNSYTSFEEYMEPVFDIERIERVGIYTNLFLGRKHMQKALQLIIDSE